GAAIAFMDVGAPRGLLRAELDAARRLVRLEPLLSFGRERRRVAEEPVAGPARRIAALGARRQLILLGRAAPQAVEVALVVRPSVRVRRAAAAASGSETAGTAAGTETAAAAAERRLRRDGLRGEHRD